MIKQQYQILYKKNYVRNKCQQGPPSQYFLCMQFNNSYCQQQRLNIFIIK